MTALTKLARGVWTLLSWLGIGLLVCGVALLVFVAAAPRLLGWQFVIVDGGSMEPTIEVGSVAVMERVEILGAKPGDIVMFNDANTQKVVTHRVVTYAADGVSLVTKGDANSIADAVPVPPGNVKARYLYHVPEIGKAVHWLRSRGGYTSIVLVPGALVIALELISIARVVFRRDKLRAIYTSRFHQTHRPTVTSVRAQCGSGEHLGWKEMSGRGTIYSYGVVYDSPVASLQADQPYNCAVIALDDDPESRCSPIYQARPSTKCRSTARSRSSSRSLGPLGRRPLDCARRLLPHETAHSVEFSDRALAILERG